MQQLKMLFPTTIIICLLNLSFDLLVYGQCVLQACKRCMILPECHITNVTDVNNLKGCVDMIDNVSIVAVEYYSMPQRCLTANCSLIDLDITGYGRVYTYKCGDNITESDCSSFYFEPDFKRRIKDTPSTVYIKNVNATSCTAQCLAISCKMFDLDSVTLQCRMFKPCGLDRSCKTERSHTSTVVYRHCTTNCGFPDETANGVVRYWGIFLSDIARYQCNSGFDLVGVAERMCGVNGLWTNSTPICVPTTPLTSTKQISLSTTETTISITTGYIFIANTVTSNGTLTSDKTSSNEVITSETITPVATSHLGDVTSTSLITTGTSNTTMPSHSVANTTKRTNSTYGIVSAIYIRPCLCSQSTAVGQLSDEAFDELLAESVIDKKSTSAAINKLISKPDERASSKAIGSVGIVFLVLCGCLIVIFDVTKLVAKVRGSISTA